MATALPATIDTTEFDTRYAPIISDLDKRLALLLAMPLTAESSAKAAALDLEAKRFLDSNEKDRVDMKASALATCRKIDEYFAGKAKLAIQVRAVCTGVGIKHTNGGIVGRFKRQERERIEAQHREALRIEMERQAAERAAQVDQLVQQAVVTNDEGLLEVAQQVEQQPLVPSAVAQEAPVQVAGISGTDTGIKQFVSVKDIHELMRWYLKLPDDQVIDWGRFDLMFFVHFKSQEGGFNATLRSSPDLIPDSAINTVMTYPQRDLAR